MRVGAYQVKRGCTRVVRPVMWWNAVGVKCRVMSGQVGISRVKSGEIFSSGSCFGYAFASVFACPEPVPGSGIFFTMLIHCSNRRQDHAGQLALGGMVSCPAGQGRAMSGQDRIMSGQCRVRAGSLPCFGLCA